MCVCVCVCVCVDRPIIRHLYFVICFEVTGGVQVHKKSNVWVEAKIYFHICFGNCDLENSKVIHQD